MLSKYSRCYSVGDGVALYSTISGALVFVPGVKVDDLGNELSLDARKRLRELRLSFESEAAEESFVRDAYQRAWREMDRDLYMTVEITTGCNFRCQFCYQDKKVPQRTLDDSVEETLLSFLGRSNLAAFKTVNVNFIGGEPLLCPGRVMSVWRRVADLARSFGCRCTAKVNTNGYCLDGAVVDGFDNAEFVVPLGAPSDYGGIVRLAAMRSCDLRADIKRRLVSLVSHFEGNRSNRIVLRFNANHENVGYVGDYFKEVAEMGFPDYRIDVVNTNNARFSLFQNKLGDDAFWRWYLDVVIPLCQRYSLPEPVRFRNRLSRCKARRKGSFKLFADGRVGICNGIEHSQALPVLKDLDTLEDVDRLYAAVKTYDYMQDERCRLCDKIFICGGEAVCHVRSCEKFEDRIEAYVRRKIELMRK